MDACRSKEVRHPVHLVLIADLDIGVCTELGQLVGVLQASWNIECAHVVGVVVALLVSEGYQVFGCQIWGIPCGKLDWSVGLLEGSVGVEVEVKVASVFVSFEDHCACLRIFYHEILVLVLRARVNLNLVLPLNRYISDGRIIVRAPSLLTNFPHRRTYLLKFLADVIILHVCLILLPVDDDSVWRKLIVYDVIFGPIQG